MNSKRFSSGDLVWVKMKYYCPWPARIEDTLPPFMKPSKKKGHYCVFFYGTENYAFVSGTQITPHSLSVLDDMKKSKQKSALFKKALDDLVLASKSDAQGTLCDSIETSVSSPSVSRSKKGKKGKKVSYRFGFIGIGSMGKSTLKKLLQAGLDVTVFSYDLPNDCQLLKGKKTAESPADLVLKCDVIVCCCPHRFNVHKIIVFGKHGILEGFDKAQELGQLGKCYVDMSAIHSKLSIEIFELISEKGGLYMEARLCATSPQDAQDGTFVVMVKGEPNVYDEFSTNFHFMGSSVCNMCYSIYDTTQLF